MESSTSDATVSSRDWYPLAPLAPGEASAPAPGCARDPKVEGAGEKSLCVGDRSGRRVAMDRAVFSGVERAGVSSEASSRLRDSLISCAAGLEGPPGPRQLISEGLPPARADPSPKASESIDAPSSRAPTAPSEPSEVPKPASPGLVQLGFEVVRAGGGPPASPRPSLCCRSRPLLRDWTGNSSSLSFSFRKSSRSPSAAARERRTDDAVELDGPREEYFSRYAEALDMTASASPPVRRASPGRGLGDVGLSSGGAQGIRCRLGRASGDVSPMSKS